MRRILGVCKRNKYHLIFLTIEPKIYITMFTRLLTLIAISIYIANTSVGIFVEPSAVASESLGGLPYAVQIATFLRNFLIDTYVGSNSLVFSLHGLVTHLWFAFNNCVDGMIAPGCNSA